MFFFILMPQKVEFWLNRFNFQCSLSRKSALNEKEQKYLQKKCAILDQLANKLEYFDEFSSNIVVQMCAISFK